MRASTIVLGFALSLSPLTMAACGSETPAPSTGGSKPSGDGAGEGGNATDFTLTDVEGNQVSLADYLGKKAVLINFWATWCKPCTAEMVHLQKMYEARKDKFVVLAVSIDGPETESSVAPYVKNKGYTFPVLVDTETRVTSLYNPRKAAPFTVLIDIHGKIVKKREGFNAGDEKQLEADVEAALK